MENNDSADFKNSFESWLKKSDMTLKGVAWRDVTIFDLPQKNFQIVLDKSSFIAL